MGGVESEDPVLSEVVGQAVRHVVPSDGLTASYRSLIYSWHFAVELPSQSGQTSREG